MDKVSRYATKELVFVVVATFSLVARADNVILNPSFEIAGPGGNSVSAFWQQGVSGVDGVLSERSSSIASDGNWSHLLSSQGNTTNGGTLSVAQEHMFNGLPSLAPAQSIILSFDVKHFMVGSSTSGSAAFSIVGPNVGIVDQVVWTFGQSNEFVAMQTSPLQVPEFGASFPLDSSYYVQLVFTTGSSPSGLAYAESYIDNVVVDAILVPEPRSVLPAMFMLFVIVATWRRRVVSRK